MSASVGSPTGAFPTPAAVESPMTATSMSARVGPDAVGQCRRCEVGATRVDRRADDLHGFVDGLAGRLLLVDRGQATELRLELGEWALLAEQPAVERCHRFE